MLIHRLSGIAWVCLLAAGMFFATGMRTADAADLLTEAGAVLADVQVAMGTVDLTRDVQLNGDVPSETYVAAFFSNGTALKRTNSGYWLSWDGDLDTLVDNHSVSEDDQVHFKILNEDVTNLILPATIMVAYRVGDAFKFGVFQIMAN